MHAAEQAYMTMKIGTREFDFSHRTYVMGILNVTPDSFSDGGKFLAVDKAVARALQMIDEGADIIDIGGESTRPKTMYGEIRTVSAEEEMERVVPVIEKIVQAADAVISIDTTKSIVAEAAMKAGATIINDISGLKFDERIAEVAARYDATLVLMHIQGTPETMQINPTYNDVVSEVKEELRHSVEKARSYGVKKIIVDPGIGFGKNVEHNVSLLKHLGQFCEMEFPVLIGTSRKGFIGSILDLPVDERLIGTASSVAVSIMNGANIIRVHDVKEMKQVSLMVDRIMRAK